MWRASSRLTVIFKIAIPVFWLSATGLLVVISFVAKDVPTGDLSLWALRLIFIGIFLSGIIIFYLLTFNLKRVEFSPEFLYVSNYKDNVRYNLEDVDRITLEPFFLFKIGRVHLKGEGRFGKKFPFLSRANFLEKLALNPEVAEPVGNLLTE